MEMNHQTQDLTDKHESPKIIVTDKSPELNGLKGAINKETRKRRGRPGIWNDIRKIIEQSTSRQCSKCHTDFDDPNPLCLPCKIAEEKEDYAKGVKDIVINSLMNLNNNLLLENTQQQERIQELEKTIQSLQYNNNTLQRLGQRLKTDNEILYGYINILDGSNK